MHASHGMPSQGRCAQVPGQVPCAGRPDVLCSMRRFQGVPSIADVIAAIAYPSRRLSFNIDLPSIRVSFQSAALMLPHTRTSSKV